jgi:hypothetical protein
MISPSISNVLINTQVDIMVTTNARMPIQSVVLSLKTSVIIIMAVIQRNIVQTKTFRKVLSFLFIHVSKFQLFNFTNILGLYEASRDSRYFVRKYMERSPMEKSMNRLETELAIIVSAGFVKNICSEYISSGRVCKKKSNLKYVIAK